MEDVIFGRGPVLEAIRSGRAIDKLVIKEGEYSGSLARIVTEAKRRDIVITRAKPQKLDKICGGGNSQGVAAFVTAYEYVTVEDILMRAKKAEREPFVVICDKITDPHNLGAIIRTACCAGADGVIIPKRGGVGVNGTVMKTSAGAAQYVPVAKVTNIAQTIEQLQREGLWITAADMDGRSMYDVDLTGAIGLVVGSEGDGVSRLVREKCDFVASIPMMGEINSLNASVAAGVLMYEALRQRAAKAALR